MSKDKSAPDWRTLYAVGLWHCGVPVVHIGRAFGNIGEPVSHQRVYQMLGSVGIKAFVVRREEKETLRVRIVSALETARREGLTLRPALIASICAATGCSHRDADRVISARFGVRKHVPPFDIPDDWRWCRRGDHFVPELARRTRFGCRACETARIREYRSAKAKEQGL